MGFSLKNFFEELERMIQEAKSVEDLKKIHDFVADERAYAAECGQLH